MRDEPTGRYALKLKDRPLTARTFHLYRDCGHVAAVDTGEMPGAELIEPSDVIVELLLMRVCQACENRSKEVDAEDVIAGVLDRYGVVDDVTLASTVLESLEANGYVIKRTRRGGA